MIINIQHSESIQYLYFISVKKCVFSFSTTRLLSKRIFDRGNFIELNIQHTTYTTRTEKKIGSSLKEMDISRIFAPRNYHIYR